MRDTLSALHNPDNSSLRLVVAISSHTLMGLLIFLLGLFGLNLVDLDAVPWVCEVEIHAEGICFADVFTFWLFTQNAELCASKGLERPLELGIVYDLLAEPLDKAHAAQM